MFQHSALPTPAFDLPQSMPRIRVLEGLSRLDQIVPLPQTLKGYLTFLLVLSIVAGLALLQVWTSLQITKAQARLDALEIEYSLLQQRNAELLWEIGQHTTLEQVQTRSVQLGFRPSLKRKYLYSASVDYPSALETSEHPPVQAAPDLTETGTQAAPAQEDAAGSESEPGVGLWPLQPAAPTVEAPVTPPLIALEFDTPLPNRQQTAEWIQEGWRKARNWAAPLIEQARTLILGQLDMP